MGLGLLYGQPTTYLSPDWYATGDRLAYWIEHEIPCFVGNVPIEYTEALLAVFRKHYVPDRIIREAFLKLEKKGTRFDWGVNAIGFHGGIVAPPSTSSSGAPPPPQMRAVSKGEADRTIRYTFEEYERRYVLAIKTNDAAGAEAIIAAVLQLLWELARGYGKTRQAARHEKMVEWEEFDAAIDEAMDRARTLQTHVRYLSREELKSLRDAPTPTALRNVTFRLASRVTTRTVPPARRGRR
jgi:hypothetical protein